MPKALVAMSGGVDSIAAAVLMMKNGFDVCGVNMLLCQDFADSSDAEKACKHLGIDFFTVDCRKLFEDKVINPFVNSYCIGKTPNPCISCNKHLKFGFLFEEAKRRGFDVVATGHYAKLGWDEVTGEPILKKAADLKKDQSYVLYSVEPQRLRDICLPLGNITKDQARQIVKDTGIDIYKKSESQDICFIPNGDYYDYIIKNRGNVPPEGNFVDRSGRVLGKHKGIVNYTIGQRRGLGVSGAESYYVIDKNLSDNSIVLGYENELMTTTFNVGELNVLSSSLFKDGTKCSVRTRYQQAEHHCTVVFENNNIIVETDGSIRKPAPGQSAVFYYEDRVIAGGIIF